MTVTEKYLKDKAELIAKKERYDKEYEEFNKALVEYDKTINNFHTNRMKEYIDRVQNMWDGLCKKYNETEKIEINFFYEDYRDGKYSLTVSLGETNKARVPWKYKAKINYENKMVCGGDLTGLTFGVDNFDMTKENINLWKICVEFTEYLNLFNWDAILRYPKEEYAKDIADIEYPKKSDFLKENSSTLYGKHNYQRTMDELILNYVLDYSIENKVPVKLSSWEYALVIKNTPKSFKYNEVKKRYDGDGYRTWYCEKMKRKNGYLGNSCLLDDNGMPNILEQKKIG